MHCVTFREINRRTKKNGFKDKNKTIVQPIDTGILPFIARQCTPVKMSQMLPSQEAAILQNVSNQASELALTVRGQILVEKNWWFRVKAGVWNALGPLFMVYRFFFSTEGALRKPLTYDNHPVSPIPMTKRQKVKNTIKQAKYVLIYWTYWFSDLLDLFL